MTRQTKSKPRTAKPASQQARKPKAGRSKDAAASRHAAFVEAYLTNGHNATAAAGAAGLTGRQLGNAGWKMLQRTEVQALLALRAHRVAELADMNTANWAAELRAIAFSRIGDLVGADGQLVPVELLAPHVQASIAAVKAGPHGVVEYKLWNKPAVLELMARHLGLFEKDNAQLKSDILVRVELVG